MHLEWPFRRPPSIKTFTLLAVRRGVRTSTGERGPPGSPCLKEAATQLGGDSLTEGHGHSLPALGLQAAWAGELKVKAVALSVTGEQLGQKALP